MGKVIALVTSINSGSAESKNYYHFLKQNIEYLASNHLSDKTTVQRQKYCGVKRSE